MPQSEFVFRSTVDEKMKQMVNKQTNKQTNGNQTNKWLASKQIM